MQSAADKTRSALRCATSPEGPDKGSSAAADTTGAGLIVPDAPVGSGSDSGVTAPVTAAAATSIKDPGIAVLDTALHTAPGSVIPKEIASAVQAQYARSHGGRVDKDNVAAKLVVSYELYELRSFAS